MKLDPVVGPTTLRRILDALANALTFRDNFQAKLLGPITTPGADVEFTVDHNLGVTPTMYLWNVDQGVVVYDSRRNEWTNRQLFLKCSGAGATLYLVVM